MKCPVCADNTISVRCHDEWQGESPMTGLVAFVDEIERECDCALTPEQEKEVEDNAVCDEYEWPEDG